MYGLRIGFALCGSFCTFERACEAMERMVAAGAVITPIMSFHAAQTDTRFGTAAMWYERITAICGREPLLTLPDVEPIGPKALLDVLVVAPCTGTTLGKLSTGISNTPVTLAVKSHLRGNQPVVLAVCTNDALGASLRNIGQLKNTKNIFFAPLRQDDAVNKPQSMVTDFDKLEETVRGALRGEQIVPFIV